MCRYLVTTGSMNLSSSSSPVPCYIHTLLSCRCTVLYIIFVWKRSALISIRSFVIYITRISTYQASYYSNTLHINICFELRTAFDQTTRSQISNEKIISRQDHYYHHEGSFILRHVVGQRTVSQDIRDYGVDVRKVGCIIGQVSTTRRQLEMDIYTKKLFQLFWPNGQ